MSEGEGHKKKDKKGEIDRGIRKKAGYKKRL